MKKKNPEGFDLAEQYYIIQYNVKLIIIILIFLFTLLNPNDGRLVALTPTFRIFSKTPPPQPSG